MTFFDPIFSYFAKDKSAITRGMYKQSRTYKDYGRFPQTPLSHADLSQVTLEQALLLRHSAETFSKKPVPLATVGTLLYWAAGLSNSSGLKHRAYPSGGAKYPLEIYPVALHVDGLARGVYHYHVERHALEHLQFAEVDKVLSSLNVAEEVIRDAHMLFLVSFIKQRSYEKYGALSYKLGLIEAGHLGQNFYLISSSLGIGCRAKGEVGGTCNQALGLDGMNESVIYTVAIGSTT